MSTQNTTASIMSNGTSHNRTTSKTAPARLEGFDDDEEEDNALYKVHLHVTLSIAAVWRVLSVFLICTRVESADAKSTPSYFWGPYFSVFQDKSERGALHMFENMFKKLQNIK